MFREPEALLVLPHLLAAEAIVVPQLFFLELANIGRTKVPKGQTGVDDAHTMLSETDGLACPRTDGPLVGCLGYRAEGGPDGLRRLLPEKLRYKMVLLIGSDLQKTPPNYQH